MQTFRFVLHKYARTISRTNKLLLDVAYYVPELDIVYIVSCHHSVSFVAFSMNNEFKQKNTYRFELFNIAV